MLQFLVVHLEDREVIENISNDNESEETSQDNTNTPTTAINETPTTALNEIPTAPLNDTPTNVLNYTLANYTPTTARNLSQRTSTLKIVKLVLVRRRKRPHNLRLHHQNFRLLLH
ncbi:unnamed protein product [Parnassius apollo]|uniref:(apollo) hypothetical protein n=1 Tax=Parnassius apollo TaxID=110799 RepID=A0A8S3WVV2_PARAO|nr:unnamed protein product [Parnassius apollo]